MRVVSEYLANLIASRVEYRNFQPILNELRWIDDFAGIVITCPSELKTHLSDSSITTSELRIWLRYGFNWSESPEGFHFWQGVANVGLAVADIDDEDCITTAGLGWKYFIRRFDECDHLHVTLSDHTPESMDVIAGISRC